LSRLRLLLVAVTIGALLSGCGRSEAAGAKPTPGKAVKVLDLPGLPADLHGLKVAKEDVTEPVSRVDSAFIDGLALYSLRAEDLVQATLQVSRFNQGADVGSRKFREAVVNQVGASKPRAFRLGTHTVYLTTGTKQSIAVWFTGRYMFLLASRADYDEPRSLLRQALELRP
jgi:hypothetical protein